MKLKPAQKPKKRYVVFEVAPTEKTAKASFTDKELFAQIEANLDKFFGIWGRALATPMLLKETLTKSPNSRQFIIKIGHKFTDELKLAMARLTSIQTKAKPQNVKTTSITTSGSLKPAKSKMQK